MLRQPYITSLFLDMPYAIRLPWACVLILNCVEIKGTARLKFLRQMQFQSLKALTLYRLKFARFFVGLNKILDIFPY